jgi:hypothetical protein
MHHHPMPPIQSTADQTSTPSDVVHPPLNLLDRYGNPLGQGLESLSTNQQSVDLGQGELVTNRPVAGFSLSQTEASIGLASILIPNQKQLITDIDSACIARFNTPKPIEAPNTEAHNKTLSALLNGFRYAGEQVKHLPVDGEVSQQLKDCITLTLGQREVALNAVKSKLDPTRVEQLNERLVLEVSARKPFVKLWTNQLAYEQKSVTTETRRLGEVETHVVKRAQPLERVASQLLHMVSTDPVFLRTYAGLATLQVVSDLITESRFSQRGPRATIPRLGSVVHESLALLESGRLGVEERKSVYGILEQMRLKPQDCERVLTLQSKYEQRDPKTGQTQSDLRDPSSFTFMRVLTNFSGQKSPFLQKQRELRTELLGKINSLSRQGRFEHFEELFHLAEKLVFSADPINSGTRGNVGLELEYKEKQNNPWKRASVDGFDNGFDCSWRELRILKQDIAYNQRWLCNLTGARRLILDASQTYSENTGTQGAFTSSYQANTMHIHFDKRHVNAATIQALFRPFFHSIRNNDLGTWEVRGLCPPMIPSRGLDSARVADLAEMVLNAQKKPLQLHRIELSDRSNSHSPAQLMWGHLCSRINDPQSLLAGLMTLKSSSMYSIYEPSQLAQSFSDPWKTARHLQEAAFESRSIRMVADWANFVYAVHKANPASTDTQLFTLKKAYLHQLPSIEVSSLDTDSYYQLLLSCHNSLTDDSPLSFTPDEIRPLLSSSRTEKHNKAANLLIESGNDKLIAGCTREIVQLCTSKDEPIQMTGFRILRSLGDKVRLSSEDIHELLNGPLVTKQIALNYLINTENTELIGQNMESLEKAAKKGLKGLVEVALRRPEIYSADDLIKLLRSGDSAKEARAFAVLEKTTDRQIHSALLPEVIRLVNTPRLRDSAINFLCGHQGELTSSHIDDLIKDGMPKKCVGLGLTLLSREDNQELLKDHRALILKTALTQRNGGEEQGVAEKILRNNFRQLTLTQEEIGLLLNHARNSLVRTGLHILSEYSRDEILNHSERLYELKSHRNQKIARQATNLLVSAGLTIPATGQPAPQVINGKLVVLQVEPIKNIRATVGQDSLAYWLNHPGLAGSNDPGINLLKEYVLSKAPKR